MSKFVLLAETGGDVPKQFAEQYGIYIVPMHVSFGTETKNDGSFDIEELYGFYEKTGTIPKTSGCTPHDFEEIFARIHKEHPESHIIHLAYSAVTTCSYHSAALAAEGLDYVTSFDTKQVSGGQAMVVIAVARYLEQNPDCSLEDVLRVAEEYSRKCHMGFFPGDLAYLRAGGRVSNAAYMGAKLLSLNPLIEIEDGYLNATKKYRGKLNRITKTFMEEFTAKHRLKKDILCLIYSKGLTDVDKKAMEGYARELGYQELIWVRTGGVVSTHSGPGAYGIAGFET